MGAIAQENKTTEKLLECELIVNECKMLVPHMQQLLMQQHAAGQQMYKELEQASQENAQLRANDKAWYRSRLVWGVAGALIGGTLVGKASK